MEWRWLNEHRLTHGLDQCPDDELDDVLDALDMLLVDPANDSITTRMPGTRDHTERWVALLPHGWVIVYTPYPGGVPPVDTGPALVVRHFSRS